MKRAEWYGCYDGSWQSAPLVPEAYSHPAKMAFGLAERIYRHMLAEGWLEPGGHVLDCFGGIGGCAFHAALYGLHWTGVELEPKFVALAQQNLDLWRERYAPHFPGYGSARILQGDSRRLCELVGGADGVVSSPPWEESNAQQGGKQRNGGKDLSQQGDGYGSTPGQLGALPAGDFDGVVSSPPFQGTEPAQDTAFYREHREQMGRDPNASGGTPGHYGDSAGQVGAMESDTFWAASRTILEQCYAVLRPGAVAAWVCGDFVRNKKRVPFGEQWLALCESVGFEPLAWATAWKQTDHGAQLDIFGEAIPQGKTKVSFFRRLANAKNPDAAILNEDVIFVRKPGPGGRGYDAVVSSPPYSGDTRIAGFDSDVKASGGLGKQYKLGNNPGSDAQVGNVGYGSTPGQLGALPAGDSPPARRRSEPVSEPLCWPAESVQTRRLGPPSGWRTGHRSPSPPYRPGRMGTSRGGQHRRIRAARRVRWAAVPPQMSG